MRFCKWSSYKTEKIRQKILDFQFFLKNNFLNTHSNFTLTHSGKLTSPMGLTFDFVDQVVKPRGAS